MGELINSKQMKEETIGVINNKIEEYRKANALNIPNNYSVGNALQSAWLILQETKDSNKNPVLESCTKQSISNCLFDMVIQGLSPAKKQCYFVSYGNKLTLMRSYSGSIAVAKRFSNVKNVYANIIYEADEFHYKINVETGLKEITIHNQELENVDNSKIRGAYAVITRENEPPYIEVMSISQIEKAWSKNRYYKKDSGVHADFAEEMAKKTVINRACKSFINTSNDSEILAYSFNNTQENEYQAEPEVVVPQVKKDLDFDSAPQVIEQKPQESTKQISVQVQESVSEVVINDVQSSKQVKPQTVMKNQTSFDDFFEDPGF